MANINVTYAEMQDAATRLTSGKDDVNAKLTELKLFIASLVDSGYVTDRSSVAFNEKYGVFTARAMETVGALDQLAAFLRAAADALADTDSTLAAGITNA